MFEKRYVGPTHDYRFSNSLMNSLAWRYRADLEIQGGLAYENYWDESNNILDWELKLILEIFLTF